MTVISKAKNSVLLRLMVTKEPSFSMRPAVFLSSGVVLCLVWSTFAVDVEVDPAWENIFRTRSDDDWRAVWHTERHRRCYHDLLVHMDWVCQKDIYSVRRRRKRSSATREQSKGMESPFPFIDEERANNFLGKLVPSRRRRQYQHILDKRGIIDECCHGAEGCSWEEYAEYCPANSRVRNS